MLLKFVVVLSSPQLPGFTTRPWYLES